MSRLSDGDSLDLEKITLLEISELRSLASSFSATRAKNNWSLLLLVEDEWATPKLLYDFERGEGIDVSNLPHVAYSKGFVLYPNSGRFCSDTQWLLLPTDEAAEPMRAYRAMFPITSSTGIWRLL